MSTSEEQDQAFLPPGVKDNVTHTSLGVIQMHPLLAESYGFGWSWSGVIIRGKNFVLPTLISKRRAQMIPGLTELSFFPPSIRPIVSLSLSLRQVSFDVAFDNVHLCHVSKMYCSVVALVRKVYNQIGRHGSSRGCYCYCSMCLACGYDARAEKACCIVVCIVGSIMYTYLIRFHPVRGVRTGWRRDIASSCRIAALLRS
eukprot:scaffold5487_cov153-Skeletonema_marinoi.AAC.2